MNTETPAGFFRVWRGARLGLGCLFLAGVLVSCGGAGKKSPGGNYPSTFDAGSAGEAGPVFPGDRSEWLRDITLPDGARVRPRESLTKEWLIRNGGTVPWRNRYIVRIHDPRSRDLEGADRTPIPDTEPGKECTVRVRLRAPSSPGECVEIWKMADDRGVQLLPGLKGLTLQVQVKAQ